MRTRPLTILLLILFTGAAFADTVYLKNGRKLEGKIISEGEDAIKLKMKYGIQTIERNDIERIEKSEPAEEEKPGQDMTEKKEKPKREETPEDNKPPRDPEKTKPAAKPLTPEEMEKKERRARRLIARLYGINEDKATRELIELGRPATRALIRELRTGHEHFTERALRILGKIGDKQAVEPLIEKLERWTSDSDKASLCAAAAQALGEIGDSRAVEPLLRVIASKCEYRLASYWACIALGEIGDRKATKTLVEIIKSRSGDTQPAAEALGNLGDKSAIPHLRMLYDDCEDDAGKKLVRLRAAYALVKLADDREAFEHMVKSTGDIYVSARKLAVKLLGDLKDKKAVEPLIKVMTGNNDSMSRIAVRALVNTGEPAMEPLLKILKDLNPNRHRAAALRALGEIGDRKAIKHFIAFLISEAPEICWEAAIALGKMREKSAVEPLLKVLKSDYRQARYGAMRALGEIGDERAVAPLVKIFREEETLRSGAGEALADIGGPAVEALVEIMNDKEANFKNYGALLLGKTGSDKAVEPLSVLLADDEYRIRRTALLALAGIGTDKAVDALSEALKHKDKETRQQAVDGMGKTYNSRAVRPLAEMLKIEKDESTCCAAVKALGVLGFDGAVKPLVEILKHEKTRLRSSVPEALGRIGTENAFQALLQALTNDNRRTVTEAIEALGRLGDTRAVGPILHACKDETLQGSGGKALGAIGRPAFGLLIEALKDENPGIRAAAARALKWTAKQNLGEDYDKWKKWWEENKNR